MPTNLAKHPLEEGGANLAPFENHQTRDSKSQAIWTWWEQSDPAPLSCRGKPLDTSARCSSDSDFPATHPGPQWRVALERLLEVLLGGSDKPIISPMPGLHPCQVRVSLRFYSSGIGSLTFNIPASCLSDVCSIMPWIMVRATYRCCRIPRCDTTILVPGKGASLNLILVQGLYLILLNIKPGVPVGSMIKNALVLINPSSDSARGWDHCVFQR